MERTKQELAIMALLDGNTTFRKDWMGSPQVSRFPCDKSRETHFLLVNVCFGSEGKSKEKLAAGFMEAAQLIIGSGLLTDEKAVEISAFVDLPEQEIHRRAFRLIIEDTAFAQAIQISSADLKNQRNEGIKCQWPLQPIS